MNQHRTIWRFTGLVVTLTILVFAVRYSRNAMKQAVSIQRVVEGQEAAERSLLTLLEKDPRVRRAPTQRMVEQVAEYASRSEGESAVAYYALGLLEFYGRNNLPEAETALRKSTKLDDDWSRPLNGLAIVLFTKGDEAQADVAWARALTLAPQWSRPYSDRAILYRRAGRMDDATKAIEHALKLDPEGPVTHYNYGVLLDVLGEHEKARAQYLWVVEKDPSLPAAHYNLACSYGREGNMARAAPYLKSAIRMDDAFRKEATQDPDFDAVRDEAEFLAIVDSDPH